jgi:L-rhamnonate dehydratase
MAVVVCVYDQDGRRGVGTAGFGNDSTVPVVEQLASILIGEESGEVVRLWETMYRATLNVGRRGSVLHAISALDIALWDMLGHRLEMPVYELLGGPVKRSMTGYASRLYAPDDLEELAREAEGYVSAGFTAVKQRLAFGPEDGKAGIRRNIELLRTVADVIGPDVDHMADAYMGWDRNYAIRCVRAIEDAGIRLRWLEEPLIPDDIAGMAQLRAAVSTPISAGEHEATRYGFGDLLRADAVDIIQPDVNRLGGITEARRVWALGETFGVDVIPHLSTAHNLHLCAASPATPIVECIPDPTDGEVPDEDQLFGVLFPDQPRFHEGQVVLSDAPGLGVTLNEGILSPTLVDIS